tara:strand:+ start:458 stop:1102 length:645 start_codon:yes stop_codon:yes gene_type:complete
MVQVFTPVLCSDPLANYQDGTGQCFYVGEPLETTPLQPIGNYETYEYFITCNKDIPDFVLSGLNTRVAQYIVDKASGYNIDSVGLSKPNELKIQLQRTGSISLTVLLTAILGIAAIYLAFYGLRVLSTRWTQNYELKQQSLTGTNDAIAGATQALNDGLLTPVEYQQALETIRLLYDQQTPDRGGLFNGLFGASGINLNSSIILVLIAIMLFKK